MADDDCGKEHGMEFDEYTVALVMHNRDAPGFDGAAAAAAQDEHLAFIADLADRGYVLAAGPVFDEPYRGLSIMTVSPLEAIALKAWDPAVRVGLYTIRTLRWRLPAGALSFSPIRFPRSVAEVLG